MADIYNITKFLKVRKVKNVEERALCTIVWVKYL